MTFEQTKEQFVLAYNSNAYLNMCESDDMHNAIVAMEKQIPKKPNVIGFEQNKLISSVHYSCSACDRLLSRYKYCPECGQALDWSDTE